jgi:hypothetical protein
MDIQVKNFKENEDGTADVEVNFDKEALEVLVQWGFVAILSNCIDTYKVKD